jgi:hypothetical protein
MMLRPFWRYYGGKWRAAPRYPSPRYSTIVEPFAGAAGYSLRHAHLKVVLVDKYPVIAEVWRYLIGVSAAEVLHIPCVDSVDELPSWVPQGARWLVGFVMGAGQSSPRRTLSAGLRRFREQGKGAYGWSPAHRARVAAQVEHIRHWRVIEGDYAAAPDVEATWFVDPPYQGAGVHYEHPSTAIDFEALGGWCRERQGQVIACEGGEADWLPFREFSRPMRSAMNRNEAARELVWTSGDGQTTLDWRSATSSDGSGDRE